MSNYEIVLDLGSKYIRAGLVQDGFSVCIPAVVAKSTDGSIVAVGVEAKKAKEGTKLSYPILEGAIIDGGGAQALFNAVWDKVLPGKHGAYNHFNVKCVVPCVTSSLDKKTIETEILATGATEVSFVETPLADSAELFKQFRTRYGIVMDIGFDCTDVAVVTNGEIVSGVTLYHSGKHLSEAIRDKIMAKYLVKLPFEQADELKCLCASLYENFVSSANAYGINTKTNSVETINVASKELYDTVVSFCKKYSQVVASLVAGLPADIAMEVTTQGILLCGGGAELSGLDLFLYNELKMPVRIAKRPAEVSINGALEMEK